MHSNFGSYERKFYLAISYSRFGIIKEKNLLV